MTNVLVLRALVVLSHVAVAQAPLASADSALVGRILLAEDRRDASDPSLSQGAGHSDTRIRYIARRALERIRDPRFAARDSLGVTLAAPAVWPEPDWFARYRALMPARDDCAGLRAATNDIALAVRLQAADIAQPSCVTDERLLEAFRSWVDALPATASQRKPGQASWHLAAHGIVALARLRAPDARSRLPRLMTHPQWQVRMYAARAAAAMSDAASLRTLARDRDPNVREEAVNGLARLTGHADDALYVAELEASTPQSVRAAAIALKGSSFPGVKEAAMAAFERFARRQNASERDVRVALLEAAGRTAADDKPPAPRVELPRRAVALALGGDVRLRVTMATPDGRPSFVVRLRGDAAPMMAARVLALANARYYDGTTWQRVAYDFVVQGGGHGANEYVGYEAYFRDELGGIPHARGTVGMSTRGHDTGDGQWFVNLRDNFRLNPDYTVFAEVVEGMDVVDQIAEGDVIESIREVAP